jgi:serine/threonine protein kinase
MKSLGDENTFMPRSSFVDSPMKPNDILGNYRILSELGSGGMGFVYLAKHEHLDSVHALKVILPSYSCDEQFRKRFLQEAKIMSRLRHPNIVSCIDAGLENNIYYLVMHFVEGPRGTSMDLQDLLEERRFSGEWFEESEAIEVGEGICKGLAYAHGYCSEEIPQGIVHRDLKPANILLDRDTRLFITDFGLARLIGHDFEKSVIAFSTMGSRTVGEDLTLRRNTSTKNRVGTFDYMSPEQREGRSADRRSDVYAMGAILYELLTERKVAGVPRPPSFVRKGLNPAWDDILLNKCLCYESGERFETAEDLLCAIQGMKQDAHSAGKRSKGSPPSIADSLEHPSSPPSPNSQEQGKRWYYVSHGTRIGPMTMGEMQQLIQRKVIYEKTGVWDGLGEWRPAATTDLKELFSHRGLAPSEIPALQGAYVDNRLVSHIPHPCRGHFRGFIFLFFCLVCRI